MRLVTLNLRHGGKRHTASVLECLLAHRADVLVLTEFRGNAEGDALREGLCGGGLRHQAVSPAEPRRNSILIAAREPFRRASHRLLRMAKIQGDRPLSL